MPSVGLSMIVKNGAETLRECLASVAGLVEQIVVADTGSSDGTPGIARALGAEVLEIGWQDHFAQARNTALQAMRTDWVLVLDDDEELDPLAHRYLPRLLGDPASGGYLLPHRNYLLNRFDHGVYSAWVRPNHSGLRRAQNAPAYLEVPVCRLFRRHPEIYFVGRIHELIEPRITASGFKLKHAPGVLVHNFGALDGEASDRSRNEYYRQLGRMKVQESPDDPQAWMELGLQEYERFKDYPAAIDCFRKAMALPACPPFVYASLAKLYLEMASGTLALEVLERMAASNELLAAEKEHIRGDALYNLGRLEEARAAYQQALARCPEDSRIESKLGLTEVRLGNLKPGLKKLVRAVEAAPQIFEMHDRLIKAYVLAEMLPQAAEAAERLLAGFPHPRMFLRAASIRQRLNDRQTARNIIHSGLQLFPQAEELLQARSELAELERLVSGNNEVRPSLQG
jgi:tetratricopeptide (TPR) repeat protein